MISFLHIQKRSTSMDELATAQTGKEIWCERLVSMGSAIREHLRRVVASAPSGLSHPVAHEGGDTIYGLDRHVEPVIANEIISWPDECRPLLLIAEGMGPKGRKLFGSEHEPIRYRLIVDPIDGTRSLMYDKRSAWFLAAVAADRGEETTLLDAFASVVVELPTTKQCWADSFMAVSGHPHQAYRKNIYTGEQHLLTINPSKASTLKDGFGQVSNFFPGTKLLASDLMERIVRETIGEIRPGSADVFDDQYISSGGQMVELLLGHDRFCCDLRPLFYQIIQAHTRRVVRGVECHPYDMAGLLVAQQAGVTITDGFGRPFDCPLDVHTAVHWCGYANQSLQRAIQPIILDWLREKGIQW